MNTPRILIIDDDPDFVEVTKSVLETMEYNVSVAYNADEGFARLEEEDVDVIILDIMMGKMAEGFIFARKIKKDPRLANIPILVLTSMREQTGFTSPTNPIHEKFFPVDEYIEKPVDPHVLLGEIERLLGGRGTKSAKEH